MMDKILKSSAKKNDKVSVLIISDDKIRIDAYMKKMPDNVNASASDTSIESIRDALLSNNPAAIYILFRKGERIANKCFDPILSYVSGYNAALGISGSAAQISSLKKLAESFNVDHISTVTQKTVSEDLKRVIALYKKTAVKKSKISDDGEKKLILIVGRRVLRSGALLIFLREFFEKNGNNFSYMYASMTDCLPLRLKEIDCCPDFIIYLSVDNSDLTLKAINSLCRSEDMKSVPYALVSDNLKDFDMSKLERKPDTAVDINKDIFVLGAEIEKILNIK